MVLLTNYNFIQNDKQMQMSNCNVDMTQNNCHELTINEKKRCAGQKTNQTKLYTSYGHSLSSINIYINVMGNK